LSGKPGEVCVDAGLLLKLVLNEPDSARAEALFGGWRSAGVRLIAPVFCPVEMDSVIRRKTTRPRDQGGLTEEQAELVFAAVQGIPLTVLTVEGQRQRAWELAKVLGLPPFTTPTTWPWQSCGSVSFGRRMRGCIESVRESCRTCAI